MFESIEANPSLWILGVLVVAIIITLIGVLSGTNLTTELRNERVRRFALIGASLFFFCVIVFMPSIYSSSNTKYLNKLEVGHLATNEQIVTFENNQTAQIERMKEDIIKLR